MCVCVYWEVVLGLTWLVHSLRSNGICGELLNLTPRPTGGGERGDISKSLYREVDKNIILTQCFRLFQL